MTVDGQEHAGVFRGNDYIVPIRAGEGLRNARNREPGKPSRSCSDATFGRWSFQHASATRRDERSAVTMAWGKSRQSSEMHALGN